MIRAIYVFLVVIVVCLVVSYLQVISENARAKEELGIAKVNTEKLERRNAVIKEQIKSLQNLNSLDIYEDLARSNLSFKKEDEVFYRVYGAEE